MKILVDAFGGDNAPEEIVKGAVSALAENKEITLGFTGDKEKTERVLSALSYDKTRVEVIDAPSVITCEEEPTLAIRKKPDSSMVVAFSLLKEDKADALVSAGSSGALLVGSTLKVGRIRGVNRPALCPVLPTLKAGKKVLLLDAGANADCKAINLVQFAVMGGVYAKVALGVKKARVALLSNGTEDKKGNQLNHEAFPQLKELKNVEFAGNIEARDIMSGDFDVVVADGFSGNVALKSMEGTISALFKLMKAEFLSTARGKLGALFLKKSFRKLKGSLDYNNYGGAMFLGVDKIVVKAHGSAKSESIKNAVLQAAEAVKAGTVESIKKELLVTGLEE